MNRMPISTQGAASVTAGSASRVRIAVLTALLALQLLVYRDTFWSMVSTWWRSETFAHGFLIFPISLYLIWSRREQIRQVRPYADFWALPCLALLGMGWLLANSASVLVVEQFAVVAMIPVLVWAIYGWGRAWSMAFPLAFLFFSVPAGEFLVPPMMEFTADFTVAAVRMTGIPVFREGLYFTLPSGAWSVVEACSGVRYIIASLTLGCLYAYLTYHSYWRRGAFILLALITPILANGIRAYMIVMIGHFSSMKLATGVDHIIYGWVWFGVVIFIMFWLGSYWRDQPPQSKGFATQIDAAKQLSSKSLYSAGLSVLALLVVWPVWAGYLANLSTPHREISAPVSQQWQSVQEPINDWRPHYMNPSQIISQSYQQGAQRVGLYLVHYSEQQQGAELVNSENRLIDRENSNWRLVDSTIKPIRLADQSLSVEESLLKYGDAQLLVWRINVIHNRYTVNPYYAKLLESWAYLSGAGRSGTAVFVYTPVEGAEIDGARNRLQIFTADLSDQVKAALSNQSG